MLNVIKIRGSAGNAVKRYKEYEQDDSASTPKTTKWRSRISERNSVPDFPPNDDLSYDSESDPLFHGDVINEGSDNCITESFETEYGTQELQQILQLDNIETEDMEIDTFDENESASESDSSEEESTANYNTSTTDEEKHGSSVPLYVLPPNENIYSSDISHNEHLLSLCAFSTKNNLSGTAFCQLMKLINIHLPEKKLCETNVNRLKEKFGFGGNFIKYYDYCDICGALFPEDKTHCFCATPHCKGKRYVDDELKGRGKNLFVSGDLRLPLKEILENSENWEHVMTSFRRENVKDGMHDILDGKNIKS
ncbi:unnamed protein product [Mytilus edulis]|uniref:Uncharacterized protein n=1 Tax=Mytilus edulis TaxID=6550 RepID=A0A8S3SE78_MYTED|nr:unnamed protein product [Mytilus edulis]